MGATVELYLSDAGNAGSFFAPTHIAFLNGKEIITDLNNNRFVYRDIGAAEWLASPIAMNKPHSVCLGADGRYYANDTDNHRMISFTDLASPDIAAVSFLAGQPLDRPHDNVLDPETGYIYVIDNNRRLYRFTAFGENEEYIQFTNQELVYARSLALMDGKIHIVNSNQGEVLRIDDFATKQYTKYTSYDKKEIAPAGAWDKTGFVLNGVSKFNGWYYGTNFFAESWANGYDHTIYRLVRWQTWADFESGNWEELSQHLPANVVPYYLTLHEDSLYLAVFGHSGGFSGIDDGIYRIQDAPPAMLHPIIKGNVKRHRILVTDLQQGTVSLYRAGIGRIKHIPAVHVESTSEGDIYEAVDDVVFGGTVQIRPAVFVQTGGN